jgi:hypothetical protein
MPTQNGMTRPRRAEEWLTALIGVLVLVAAGTGVFVPGFYTGIVDPRYATGTITADAVSLLCVPVLAVCVFAAHRGSSTALLVWTSLLAYLTYAYATYAFDRMYTVLFPVYMLIFGLGCFTTVMQLTRLDANSLASYAATLPWRRVTSGFLMFTGLILYGIELPIILSRIPNGIQAGGTPFMVLDLSLVAPLAFLTGVWLWQRRPWGTVISGIFLVKAIALMTGFLIADYYDWYLGKLTTQGATIAFTVVCLLAYFFTWNYFSAFKTESKIS